MSLTAEPDPLELELLGKLRYCHKCGEWWPEDAEFWYWNRIKGCFDSPCKACRSEKRRIRCQKKKDEPAARN